MGFEKIADDIAKRYDDWERDLWSKVPLTVKVIIAPILLIPYVIFELITYLVFLVPYALLETMMNGGESEKGEDNS